MKYSFIVTLIVYAVAIIIIMIYNGINATLSNESLNTLSFSYKELILLFLIIALVINIVGNLLITTVNDKNDNDENSNQNNANYKTM